MRDLTEFSDAANEVADMLDSTVESVNSAFKFANLAQPEEPARGALGAIGTDEWRRRLLEAFADDAGPAVRLIRATQHELSATPIHSLPHLPRWYSDRMIVIGDAAHAPSPTSGQGASLSIEDGVYLARCLRVLPDVPQAFAAFEQARRPRVERIIKAVGNTRQLQELYGYHIEWRAAARELWAPQAAQAVL